MKKTILFVVLGLVTVFCICYGTVRHLGGLKHVFNQGFFISIEDEDDDTDDKVSGKYAINDKLEAFSSIRIDARIMTVVIEEGSEFAIEGMYNKTYLKPIVGVDGKRLEVKQTQQKRSRMNAGSQTCRVTITIPSNTKLDEIDIDSNVGDIKLRDVTAKEINIDTNVGEIDVRKVDFDSIKCDANVGEITVYPVRDLGEYDISVSTDVGEVRVDGHSYKRSYNSHGRGSGRIHLDTNVGEVNVK